MLIKNGNILPILVISSEAVYVHEITEESEQEEKFDTMEALDGENSAFTCNDFSDKQMSVNN